MPDAGFVFPPAFRVVTDAIAAVNGGYVEFYVAGTSTPLTVYSDSTLSTSLGSTVYLDSGGHPVSAQGGSTKVVIYTGAALIKMVVKSSAGVTLATYDNVRCAQDTSALSGAGADGAVETIVSKTSDYTILLADDGKLFNCDPTGGTFTLTLPNAATMGAGYEVSLRHAGTTTTNGVKFVTVSGQTIARDNLTTVADTLTGGGETITLVSNGANWVAANHVGARMSHPMPIQVVDRLTAAPSSPNSGAFYIINGTPTGDWLALGFTQHDLVRANGQGGWIRYVPTTDCGWLAFVQDENLNTQFQGSAWVDLSNVTAPTPTAYPNATFEDQKANGTVGGTVTTGAWTARTLNTSVANTITGCSLASNAITLPLPSGYASVTYEVTATAPFYGTETTQLRFKSTTTSKAIYSSQVSIATTGTGGIVTLHGTVTLTATEDFKLEYWAANAAGSTQGLGSATTDTDVERYARVTIKDVTALQGPRGADGAQGATGPGYYATSTSSLAIGTGSKTFTTQSGLAYAAGMTVKAVDQANSSNWMVGTCTSYSGTTLVLNVTTTNGSGTIAAWNIGLAGEQGATGATGGTGATGATGATGPNIGLDYQWSTATSGDPSAGKLLVNHATPASATVLHISETNRQSASQAAYIASWDDGTTTNDKGVVRILDVSAPGTNFLEYRITGSLTDAGSYDTFPVTYIGGAGTIANNTIVAVAFFRSGDKGADGAGSGDVVGPASATDNAIARFDSTTGKLLQNSAVTIADTTGLIAGARFANTGLKLEDTNASHLLTVAPGSDLTADRTLTVTTGDADRTLTISASATVSQDYSTAGNPQFATIELGHATDTTLSRSSAGVLAVEGVTVPLNSTSATHTAGTIELGAATDTTISRSSAGVIAVEGETVHTNSTSRTATASTIELGHASDTTLSRSSAGVLAVEGVTVALNSTSSAHTASTIELGHASDTTLSRSAAGELAVEGTVVKKVGKETIWVPAVAMTARTTNGAASGTTELTTNDVMLSTFDFDTTTEEGVGFWIAFPKSWNEGTVTFAAHWTAASGSGGVAFGLAAYAFSDDDAMDTAVSGQQVVTDTLITANDMHVSAESSAITIGGTPAEGDAVYFELTREVANGSDTLAVDAKLIGIRLFFTTNASTDA